MRTGILSDAYAEKHYAIFMNKFHKGKKKPGVAFYDLYEQAQVTMDNPYEGASEMVENYAGATVLPEIPEPPESTVIPPSSPQTNVVHTNVQQLNATINQYGSFMSSPLFDPDDNQAPRTLPHLRLQINPPDRYTP